MKVTIVAPTRRISGPIALTLLTIGLSHPLMAGQQLVPASLGEIHSAWSDGRNLYVAEDRAVKAISLTSGQVSVIAGQVSSGESVGPPVFLSGQLGIAGDGSYLYVTNVATHNLQRVNIQTREVQRLAGSLIYPVGVWVDGLNVYVASGGSGQVFRVSKSTGSTAVITSLGSGGPRCPQSSCLGSIRLAPTTISGDGTHLYAAHLNTVRKISLASGEVTTVAEMARIDNVIAVGDQLLVSDGSALLRLTKTGERVSTIAEIDNGILLSADNVNAYVQRRGSSIIDKIDLATGATSRLALTPPSATSHSFTVPPSGSVSLMIADERPAVTVGQARVQGVTPPPGLETIRLQQNGVVVSEMALAAVTPARFGRIPVEISTFVNTGIAFANPSSQPAAISFYVTDCEGSDFAVGSITLAADSQRAAFVTELPLSRGLFARPLTDACTFSFTSDTAITAISVRGLVNERSEFLMAALPVVDLTLPAPNTIVLPYFADGDGWSSRVTLFNPTDTRANGNVEFITGGGQVMRSSMYSVAPRSASTLQTEGTNTAMTVGYVRIVAAPQTAAPAASAVISLRKNGITSAQMGLSGIEAQRAWLIALQSETSALRNGVAITNPSPAPITVSIERRNSGGSPFGDVVRMTIPPNQQAVSFDEFRFTGSARVVTDSSAGILVSGLRSRINERGETIWTTMPAIPETAASPRLFPHIVMGGGYITEFLFVAPPSGPQASGTLEYRAPSGQPLIVPLR